MTPVLRATSPDRISPPGILAAAAKRPLRPGEIDALSLYITGLERQARSAREALLAASTGEHVNLSLSHDGAALNLTLPGAPPHTIRLPAQDPHLAMKFITQTLRGRQPSAPNPIGTPGAPTAADLAALARASKKRPSATTPRPAPLALSLADLGL